MAEKKTVKKPVKKAEKSKKKEALALNQKFNEQQAILNGISEVIYVSDPVTYELLYINDAFIKNWGDCTGQQCYKILQNLESPCSFCTNDRIFDPDNVSGEYVWEFQNHVTKKWYRCIDKAINWPDGRRVRYEMAIDITRQKEMEDALRAQSQEILELSTPVIQIWKGIVVAPLIGSLDSQRTQHFMERFLNSIVETQSQVALVDITGVPTIDTQTAQHLIEAITASRLLGTKAILTGVSPSIAQTLVHLGIDLSSIQTHTSLAKGLSMGLKMIGTKLDTPDPNQE